MDIITKSYFDEFKKLYGYETLAENDAFELFAIYCIASKFIKSETLSKDILEDIKIGNGGDWGIDGFLIIVNGKIVTSKKVVDDLLVANGNIAVQIVLIQAKTSTNFDVSELCMALNGIEYLISSKHVYFFHLFSQSSLIIYNSKLSDSMLFAIKSFNNVWDSS